MQPWEENDPSRQWNQQQWPQPPAGYWPQQPPLQPGPPQGQHPGPPPGPWPQQPPRARGAGAVPVLLGLVLVLVVINLCLTLYVFGVVHHAVAAMNQLGSMLGG